MKNLPRECENSLIPKRCGLSGAEKLFLMSLLKQELYLFYLEPDEGKKPDDFFDRFNSFLKHLNGDHSTVS